MTEKQDDAKRYNITRLELIAKKAPKDTVNYCRSCVTENPETGSGVRSVTSIGLILRRLSGNGVMLWDEVELSFRISFNVCVWGGNYIIT